MSFTSARPEVTTFQVIYVIGSMGVSENGVPQNGQFSMKLGISYVQRNLALMVDLLPGVLPIAN